MTDLYRFLPEEMEKLVIDMGYPRYRADQILLHLYYKFPKNISDIKQLPKQLINDLIESGYTIGSAKETHRIVSEDGDTTKLLLSLTNDKSVETVLMQYEPSKIGGHQRSTICVSTQIGCAMGCTFCATGQMGFETNLKAEHIISQVLHFAELLQQRGQHVTNLVFMGMGEPMANYDEMIRAVKVLTHPRGFGLGQRHITISTIGIKSGIEKLAEENLQIGLAISLHAPNNELRKKLVPTATFNSVEEIIESGYNYFKKTGRRVTFEYALMSGINDSPEIARDLAKLLHGNGSHVNLIPINPTAGDFTRPSNNRVHEFERILSSSGVNCTIRIEKGTEISAACGQLRTDVIGQFTKKIS
ncbi:MAG: 23S rRNA (adenine(2503)-C(2))-methyltransferase RlmN [Crenarchaeota archaeon]|nr:23S rRNA (adenine(2503)-C(2))-methyltransferase RlmN [Thermoproteota archaeon]HJJ21600.1 23S rRNA (adenine(2503)-C(2))-methyltransferase RlmN [Nitrosopumilus sp.]MDA0853241.1 23S rRNA (adenine(2503)-C(2))-methyltransferase RlmN [Thermoproteota archaeon]MDA1123081.1 23S rRNA (adenine(2503)-C(2))-methyltransferase RlmN [Thermoproteota archaeon]HJJ23723.1 23S rRNA (adenine(2503)-C(2))-methyltransferase RlmN [Nitrosopumilus sp.]